MHELPIRMTAALLVSFCALVAVSGCTEQGDAQAVSTQPSAEETPTPTPTTSAAPDGPLGTPVTVECSALVQQPALDLLFSDFAPDPDYFPNSGSTAEEIEDEQGKVCGWVNSAGDRLEVAVANLPVDVLTDLKNELVVRSNSVPTYGVEGYFQMNGPVGEAEAFFDPYWILVTSTWFAEPGDAAPIVTSAIEALG